MGMPPVGPTPATKKINSQYEEVMNHDDGQSSKASGMSAGIEHAKPDHIDHPATSTVTTHPYTNPQNTYNKVYAKPNHPNQDKQ